MTFNSIPYALFLPVVVAVFWLLPGRARLIWLAAASYVFYAAWDPRFLILIWISTGVDYLVGRQLDTTDVDRRRKQLLVVSLVVNLGILGFFKYFNFFIGSMTDLLGQFGLEADEPFLRIILPIGVSFYTFQTISYSFDVYRRRIDACRDPVLFAVFVAYFPQLVAGPIERAGHLLPQFSSPRQINYHRVESGLTLIVLGLFKKIVIADGIAPVVNETFGNPDGAGSLAMAVGVFAFAIQIYADFGGYTDIARGSSRLLGIELIHNFHEPYLSRSITEFWRRWHISLSSWLRDYLYVPLGGSRKGRTRTYLNLMATMLLGGLWHGAAWGFVIWGALQGVFLAADRATRSGRAYRGDDHLRWRNLPAVIGTFALVSFAWIFFRAPSLGAALDVIIEIGSFNTGGLSLDWLLVILMAALTLAIDLVGRRRHAGARPERHSALVGAGLGVALVGIVIYSGSTPVPFVYFQF